MPRSSVRSGPMRSRKPSASAASISTIVSFSRIRIMPIAALVMSPPLHSAGISQRGSARCLRPTESESHMLSEKLSRPVPAAGALLSCLRAAGAFTFRISMSSGAERSVAVARRYAVAIWRGVIAASIRSTVAASASVGSSACAASAIVRSSSRASTASAEGGVVHSASTPAMRRSRSAFPRERGSTIRALMPLRPARPVRPERCSSVSGLDGRSLWTTSSRFGRSMPRAATSVAMHTFARPSRSACRAFDRSPCVSSPDRATTEKPRL